MIKLFFLAVLLNSVPALAQGQDPFSGTWKFSCPDAPEGFRSGSIELIKEKEGYTGNVIMATGDTISLQKCSAEKNEITFIIQVEYEYVRVVLELKNGKLEGNAYSPEGTLSVTAEKSKK